ncbi:MAG: hypothetical protein ACRDQD_24275, partial [Nocardioidaceae bacterium]
MDNLRDHDLGVLVAPPGAGGRKTDVEQLTSGYGLIVVDECHHIPRRGVRARCQTDPGPSLARAHRHPVPPRQARRPDLPPARPGPA